MARLQRGQAGGARGAANGSVSICSLLRRQVCPQLRQPLSCLRLPLLSHPSRIKTSAAGMNGASLDINVQQQLIHWMSSMSPIHNHCHILTFSYSGPHLMRGSLALRARKLSRRVLGSSAAHSRHMLQVCLSKGCIPLQHGHICL